MTDTKKKNENVSQETRLALQYQYPQLDSRSLGEFSAENAEIENNFLIAFGVFPAFIKENSLNFELDRKSAGKNKCELTRKRSSMACSESESQSSSDNDQGIEEDVREVPLRKAKDPANRIALKDATTLCLSFGGCGFLGSYEFGAAKMIYDHGKELLKRVDRYAGCSSGSLVATILILCPEKIPDGVEEIYKMADDCNVSSLGAMSPGFEMNNRLRKVAEKFLPEDVSKADDLLFVSVTNLKTWKNEMVSKFNSRTDLIDWLMASCYHPMYSSGLSGKAPVLRGRAYIDGGYTNILPEFLDKRTVTVTAFAGEADICPAEKSALFNDWMLAFFNQNMKLTLSNVKRASNALFPPPRGILQQYFDAGARDAEKLLKDTGFYR